MTLINKFTALPMLMLLAFPLSACQKNTETAQESTATESQPDNLPVESTIHESEAHDSHDDHNGEHNGDHEGEHDEHAGHDHSAMAMTTYSCQPEQIIKVHYETDVFTDTDTANSTPRSANLLIDDIEYELTPKLTTLAAGVDNAVVYETDIGINNDAGMYWQVSGNQANLVNKTLDGKTLPEDEPTLFTCEKAAS